MNKNDMTPAVESPEVKTEAAPAETLKFVPQVDVMEDSEAFTVWADMPGVDPKEIDIRLEKDALHLSGKICRRQDSSATPLVSEYEVGDYTRNFNLTGTIDPERITADYRDGVLTLTLPKIETAKPRKIEVRRAG